MSLGLVAYATSDESDSEDNEVTESRNDLNKDSNFASQNPCSGADASSSGESESRPVSSTTIAQTGSASTRPTNDDISDSDSEKGEVEPGDGDINDKLKALPQPKSGIGVNVEENDVLEEEVKPKASQLQDAPKPPPKKAKQPVRFTISSYSKDSDDEDEPSSKKAKTTNSIQGKSGLFSLLPPPIHAAKKEANRVLIPHTLTKKVTQNNEQKTKPSTSALPPGKSKAASQKLQGLSGYGSDSDEEAPSSFFSLESSAKSDEPVLPEPPQNMKMNRLVLPPPILTTVSGTSTKVAEENMESTTVTDNKTEYTTLPVADSTSESAAERLETIVNPNESMITTPDDTGVNDEPLKFNMSHSRVPSSLSYSYTHMYRQPVSHNANRNYTYGSAYYNEAENMEYEQMSQAETTGSTGADNYGIPEQELLRLQGKRRRGKEEINFVDVNADDFTDPTEIQKHLSEEESHQSHRKKDGPTSQQKRKHQITYLAHQAKERELELKNQWSQNRMTRKQTQAKYGF